MEVVGAFKDLIDNCYIAENQVIRVRWMFASVEHLGRVTRNGSIQLLNQSYLGNGEASGDVVSQTLVPLPSTNDASSVEMVPISLTLGEKYKAPSTVTEKSYAELVNMRIVTPRNEEEKAENKTYADIITPDNVRHNGWRKLEFLFWHLDSPNIIFIPASKLRTPEARKSVNIQLLRPMLIEELSEVMLPMNALSFVENSLQMSQPPEPFNETRSIIGTMRDELQLKGVDRLHYLIERLSWAQYYLKMMRQQGGEVSNYFEVRQQMIEQRRNDPMLTQAAHNLPSMPPLDFFQDEVLEAGTIFNTDSLLFCGDSQQPSFEQQREREDNAWNPIVNVYKELLDKFKELEGSPTGKEYHKSMYGYFRKDQNEMLQKLYEAIDQHYGDRFLFKAKFNDYFCRKYNYLMATCPQPLEDCDPYQRVMEEGDDPVRNAHIQYFRMLSDFNEFLHYAIPNEDEDFVCDVLKDHVKGTETQTYSTKDPNRYLQVDTHYEYLKYSTMRITGKRPRANNNGEKKVFIKRVKKSL